MTNNPTEESVIRMEAIYKEIEDKADKVAQKISGYDPYDDLLGSHQPKLVYYEQIKRHYKAGATPYGEKLHEANEQLEKMAKAIEAWAELGQLTVEDGFSKGYTCQLKAIQLTDKALTDYQTYKQGKDADRLL